MYGPRGYQVGVDEEGQGKTPDRAPTRSPPHSVFEVLPCDSSNRHGWLKVDVPSMVVILIQTPGHCCLESLGDVPWIMAVGANFLDRSLPSHVRLGSESVFYEEFLMLVCIFMENGHSCLNGNLSFIDVKRKILLCGQEVLTQMTKGRGKFGGINLRETYCSDGVWQHNPIGIIKFDPQQEQSYWSSSILESDDRRLIVEAEKKEQNAGKDPETRASVKDEGCAENRIDKTGRYRGNERDTNLHLARIDVPYHATNCECFVSRALLVDLEPGTTDSKRSGPLSIILAVDRDTPVTKATEELNIECGAALRFLREKGMEISVKINSPQVVPCQF